MDNNNKKLMNAPVLVTRDCIIYPGFEQTLEVGRDKSIKSIKVAKEEFKGNIILLSQKKPMDDNPSLDDIFNIGVLARLKIKKIWEDGSLTVEFKALDRIKATNLKDADGYYQADMELIRLENVKMTPKITEVFEQILQLSEGIPINLLEQIDNDLSPNETIDTLAQFLPQLPIEVKQEILQELNFKKRLDLLSNGINLRQNIDKVSKDISQAVTKGLEKQQKEFYLREQLKAIKEKLGEMDEGTSEMKKYLDRLENEPFPENIKERVKQEIARYEMMPQASSESNILRSYIDWMMQIPWYQTKDEKEDLKFAFGILNKYHYGLDKVKERIIEHLAVKQNVNKVFGNDKEKNGRILKGQIICLVGPPGVGKTSLAKSIADATGRTFVKLSLGGVRDEAEIRGHRKTYIGAMPGRIIQYMKKAGTINPLFLLDEIDKMSADSSRGDPSSAMLEVLDPEQNTQFSDHYIEETYDLSNVMFIATANYIDNIPEALRDRMEIIELSSYTEQEKMHIAEKHLVPKVLASNGLTLNQLNFKNKQIEDIIKFYTREAGVRQLERSLDQVARKFVVKFLKNDLNTEIIDSDDKIIEYLGKHRFEHTQKEKKHQVGVVTGLAYTQYGGDILPIEVNYFKGKGILILTGKLGDVMKESATIALDYIKANSNIFKIDPKIFSENDIHIHVPEGAVPKDGPSAGITMTTAIISALTNQSVSKDVGMTGEITLRGNVLPIGGLKEKSISANRSGIKTILIPSKNEKDVEDIPKEVREKLNIIFVEKYDEVYKNIFNSKN